MIQQQQYLSIAKHCYYNIIQAIFLSVCTLVYVLSQTPPTRDVHAIHIDPGWGGTREFCSVSPEIKLKISRFSPLPTIVTPLINLR